ncbi:type II secretion system F family protein [bacterium]|nr:type II secretion system F family protein [bacterium]
MEKVMQPFILIYHAVAYIFSLPKTILSYSFKGFSFVFSLINFNKKTKDDSKEIEETVNKLIEEKETSSTIKDEPLFSFRYKARGVNGKVFSGTIEGSSLDDAKAFLQNEGYDILEISARKTYDVDINIGGKFGAADLSFTLTQLSTYIKAGISLIDSVRILEKQAEKPEHRKVYQKMVYELLKGENLSTAMQKQQDKFPKLLINMVKTSELTGDLTSVLDDMAEYYTSKEETRKTMISAMTYPVIVLVIAICVVIFILTTIVPKFVDMYSANDASIPGLTQTIMNISNFLTHHYIMLILIIGGVITTFILLYKHVKAFRKNVQIVMMHIPIMNKIIIYNEIYNFTKTFASLLNHGVFITDSMEILAKITNNEVYKELIGKTIINLNKGANISDSFKGNWAFPVAAYEMIVTGESTGQLGLMMEKVANYYQVLHKNLVKQLQSLLEPIMIAVLAFIVGVILLSVVMPMFDIYSKIQ